MEWTCPKGTERLRNRPALLAIDHEGELVTFDIDEHQRELRRTYGVNLHVNLSRWVIRRWWATMTVGMGDLGGVWSARSREKLVAKCERFARRDALKRGVGGALTIKVREPA